MNAANTDATLDGLEREPGDDRPSGRGVNPDIARGRRHC